jgi:hypothetical protein
MSRPRPGEAFELTEAQYKFGTGPLVCRVVGLIRAVEFDGELWWHVRADCRPGLSAATPSRSQDWCRRELYLIDDAHPVP